MKVYQQTLQHVSFLQPESIVAPIIIAVIILIVCALIAVNMILLLCAAWIVLYAGLIFLGFGGCRWTSDMAINYYRTVLGVGVSLMTMQLIIGIGVQFLQDLVDGGKDSGKKHTDRRITSRPAIMKTPGAVPMAPAFGPD